MRHDFTRYAVLAAILPLLGACSTLNSAGIGGKPRLSCEWSTGHAEIKDGLIGFNGGQAQLAMVRRFEDVDALCAELITAAQHHKTYLRVLRAQDSLVREALGAVEADRLPVPPTADPDLRPGL